MGRVNIEIDENVHRIAKAVCALENKTLIEFINEAIATKLAKERSIEPSKKETPKKKGGGRK